MAESIFATGARGMRRRMDGKKLEEEPRRLSVVTDGALRRRPVEPSGAVSEVGGPRTRVNYTDVIHPHL